MRSCTPPRVTLKESAAERSIEGTYGSARNVVLEGADGATARRLGAAALPQFHVGWAQALAVGGAARAHAILAVADSVVVRLFASKSAVLGAISGRRSVFQLQTWHAFFGVGRRSELFARARREAAEAHAQQPMQVGAGGVQRGAAGGAVVEGDEPEGSGEAGSRGAAGRWAGTGAAAPVPRERLRALGLAGEPGAVLRVHKLDGVRRGRQHREAGDAQVAARGAPRPVSLRARSGRRAPGRGARGRGGRGAGASAPGPEGGAHWW